MTMAARSYRDIQELELIEEIVKCFQEHNGILGTKSITKKLVKRLDLDPTRLGDRCLPFRNQFTSIVDKAIHGLCKQGMLLQQTQGQWILNDTYSCPQSDFSGPIEIDVNELTPLGKVERLIMLLFKESGDHLVDRQQLLELITPQLPQGISVSTIQNALSALGKNGEQYLEVPIRGAIALTPKGENVIKTGLFHFQHRAHVRHGQMKKNYPEDEFKILILYALGESKKPSMSGRDIAIRCAEIYTIEHIHEAIGPHAHDRRPFEKYCYRLIGDLKKDGYITTRVGGNDAWHITKTGWSKLKSSDFEIHNFGLDLPTEEPQGLLEPIIAQAQPVIETEAPALVGPMITRMTRNGNGNLGEEIDLYEHGREVETKWMGEAIRSVQRNIIERVGGLAPITKCESETTIAQRTTIVAPLKPLGDPQDEFEAMRIVWEALEPLDSLTQDRVLKWINARRKSQQLFAQTELPLRGAGR